MDDANFSDTSTESYESENDDDNTSSNGHDEDDSSSEESTDFWSLMIEETARKIFNNRVVNGKPGHLTQNAETLLEGRPFSDFLSQLRDQYGKIDQISTAAGNDTLLDLIQKKTNKVMDEYEDADNIEELAKI